MLTVSRSVRYNAPHNLMFLLLNALDQTALDVPIPRAGYYLKQARSKGYVHGLDLTRKGRAVLHSLSAEKQCSVFRGVTLRHDRRSPAHPWRASITYKGKRYHLGTFACEIEAALAYNEAAIRLHGSRANLNDVKEHV